MDIQSIAQIFHNDGFVVVPALFTPQQLTAIEVQLDRYIKDIVPTLEVGDVFYETSSTSIKSLFRLQRMSFFARLGADERLLEIVHAIFTEGEVLLDDVGFFGKAARDGSVTPPHQDNGFSFWEPPHVLKASLALDPATLENGVMVCQKGSHKLGVLPHKPSGVEGFSQTMVEPADRDRYPEVPCLMQSGDLTVHHTDTVHRSETNPTDQSRRMLSMVYRSSQAKRNMAGYEKVQCYRKQLHGKVSPESKQN